MPTKQFKYYLCGSDKGFTLIEALIAMAIFSIGFLAMGSMLFWNARNNTTGNQVTQATLLARAQLEAFKNESDVTVLTDGADANNPIDADGQPGGIYTRSWEVTNPFGGNTSRQIEVTVSWTWKGQERTVVLTSLTRGKGS